MQILGTVLIIFGASFAFGILLVVIKEIGKRVRTRKEASENSESEDEYINQLLNDEGKEENK